MNADAKFLRLSKLRSLRHTEQVAAVCYRTRGEDIEFLLVQTGGGRWIFPKGGVEPGLTHAQAAAIEAYEEAGVHGRIEEESFTRYRVGRSGKGNTGKQSVTAHLCEVLRLASPQESGRNRTWFSPEKAKRRLQDDRPTEEGAELSRIVNRAVIRIKRSHNQIMSPEILPSHPGIERDPLQKVRFEARAIEQTQGQIDALYTRYIGRLQGDAQRWADGDFAVAGLLSKPSLRLGGRTAAASAIHKVTAIDQARCGKGKARI